MPNDFKKPEPSKAEKLFYELALAVQRLEQSQLTNTATVIAAAMLMKIPPEDMAKIIINQGFIKEYAEKINAEIRKLTAPPPIPPTPNAEQGSDK